MSENIIKCINTTSNLIHELLYQIQNNPYYTKFINCTKIIPKINDHQLQNLKCNQNVYDRIHHTYIF